MSHEELIKLLKEAIAHHKAGRNADAEPLYRQVLEHNPNVATAMQNLGLILSQQNKKDEAIELMQKSVELEPGSALYFRNLGAVCRGAERAQEAVVALRKATELAPDDGLCWADLGVSLDRAGYTMEAMAVYEKAIRILTPVGKPADPDEKLPPDGTPTMELGRAHYNLGTVLARLKKPKEALPEYEASIRIVPMFGESHRNRAAVLFSFGRMREAWQEYEWRWKCADYPGKYPTFKQPRWDGSDLHGKTILIWWEQGFGDTIMFCRYAKLLVERGGRVALMCQKELKRLLRTLNNISDLAYNAEKRIEFDTHSSLMSLPALLGTDLDTIPSQQSYLSADPKDVEVWRNRIDSDGPGFRVGIVWKGAAAHKSDKDRSIPLPTLIPLLETPGVKFYNLQLGEPARDLRNLHPNPVIDHTAHIHDFADSAAFIHCLDLLISVDTAPAHLGGAIGKRTWLLLPHEPEFRWMCDTEQSSRWYPSVRIFRQSKAGDWKEVISRVVKELRKILEGLRTEC